MNWIARLFNRSTWKWLYIGLGIKRWLVLLLLGITVIALGIAYILIDVYREVRVPEIFYYLTLQFIDRTVRGILFGVAGIAMIIIAISKLSSSLLYPFTRQGIDLADALYRKRTRERGPKIVAIGGGTGLSTLLRGLKEHTDNLTAIVTVADDGGSSGRLRRELGVLPPGDFRQCIAALADAEPLMSSLLQYRFGAGTGLEGHSFGNLLIAAMAGVTGNFERALLESSRVLAVRGRILPSTLQNVTLCAEQRSPNLVRVAGESEITHRGNPIERVYLEPEHVPAYPGVMRAILEADLVIAGPGSLYTSVLPNLIVDDIKRALEATSAAKIYVCNVATQPGETDDFTVEDHFEVLEQHVGAGIFSAAMANNNFNVKFPEHSTSKMVHTRDGETPPFEIVLADLVDEALPWRHDPAKLAKALIKWYNSQSK
jgi:uncharacterized cofD-like protein